ncbi:hypothetical protein DFJ77DRAFT_438697 [Powellomyces hirtus]|nr:hypothetical protein DFJ77DRAFT_438697 [Powellomyces hirtus]
MTSDNPEEVLAEYLESISNLPSEFAFNMTLLRSLDESFHSSIESMRHNSRSYAAIMKMRKTPTTSGAVIIGAEDDARGALMGYRSDYRDAIRHAEMKVETSQRVLEIFQVNLSRLEKQIAKLETEEMMPPTTSRKRRRPPQGTGAGSSQDAYQDTRKRGSAAASASATPTGTSPSSEDEILYCICRQVSYGDMVGCDNPSCQIEWFHYSCVGLVHPPKGKWYCSTCLDSGVGRAINLTLPPATPATKQTRHKKSYSDFSFLDSDAEDGPHGTPTPHVIEDEDLIVDVEETGDEDKKKIKVNLGLSARARKEGVGAARRRKKMEARQREN